jgi:hypothetical protein
MLSPVTSVSITSSEPTQISVQSSTFFIAEVGSSPNAVGSSTITAVFPGKNGTLGDNFAASYVIGVNQTENNVQSIDDVRVVNGLTIRDAETSTLSGTVTDTFYTVFTVTFEDGFVISHAAMGRGDFDLQFLGSGLFTFTSENTAALNYTSPAGEIALLRNDFAASVTVSHTTVSGTSQAYVVNLEASEEFGMDLASDVSRLSSGEPLAVASTTVTVGVYMSFPSTQQFGALQMELMFDSDAVAVQGVQPGADFAEDFASEATTHKVAFGGIALATPLQGNNQHIADVVFHILNASALAEFSTVVISIAEVSGNNDFPTPIFGASSNVWLDLSGNRRQRRSTNSRDIYSESSQPSRTRRVACSTFPLGDVNGDCTFDTTDVLLTNAYLALNGQAAIDQFLIEKQALNIIKRNDSETAMDADSNFVIQLADASYMMYVSSCCIF